jgi:uncharacterized iron-regulated protein
MAHLANLRFALEKSSAFKKDSDIHPTNSINSPIFQVRPENVFMELFLKNRQMNRLLLPFVFLFSLLMLSAPLQAQPFSKADYKIYSVAAEREISLAELVDAVEGTDVLFWGEEHNDSLGHWLQDTLYALLLAQYGPVTLSLEMFETDCQQVLDEYLAGFITESQLIKDGRAWGNYREAYRPLVERAKAAGLPVIAANAPRRYVSLVSRKGLGVLAELPRSARRYLPPLPIYTADSNYYRRFQAIMGESGHSMGDGAYHAQCTWDASMAYRIYEHWRKNKGELIFHLNGSFHTNYQQGTITQLRRLHKKIRIRNLSCFPAEDYDQPNWKEYSELGDFMVISRSENP